MKSLIILVFALFFFNVLNAEYVSTKTIAIPQFNCLSDNNQYQWLSEAISDMLTTDIAATQKIRVVNRVELKKIISFQKYNLSDIVNDNTKIKLGNMLGASILIDGSFSIINQVIRIDAKIFDVEKGVSIGAASVNGNVENLFLLEKQLTQKIFGTLNIDLSTEDEITLFQIDTNSIFAVENNYKGIIELDNKNFDKAKEYFIEAQKEDPYYKQAKLNIDKTKIEVSGKSLFASALNEIETKKRQKEELEDIIKEFINSCLDISINGKPEIITHPDNKAIVDLTLEVSIQDNEASIKRFINSLKKISEGESYINIAVGKYFPYEKEIKINLFKESRDFYYNNQYSNKNESINNKYWIKNKNLILKSKNIVLYKKQISIIRSYNFYSNSKLSTYQKKDIKNVKDKVNTYSIMLKDIPFDYLQKIDKIEVIDEK